MYQKLSNSNHIILCELERELNFSNGGREENNKNPSFKLKQFFLLFMYVGIAICL
jgi:hypothetical protein